MATGERIKQLRLAKHLTQEQLGALVGVKKAAINKYETGLVVNLKRSMIAKLSSVLDTSPAYLIGMEDSPTGTAQTPAPGTGDGRAAEFVALFSRLTPEQQALVVAQIKGILAQRE